MKNKIQQHILKDKKVYVGLEDSKKTWKLCVRSGGCEVAGCCSMPAQYENLRNYFRNNFPGCEIRVMYEAGFSGFNLHDRLTADGWDCMVTPPHTVVQEKCTRIKNDRIDCRRLWMEMVTSTLLPTAKSTTPGKVTREQLSWVSYGLRIRGFQNPFVPIKRDAEQSVAPATSDPAALQAKASEAGER